jgi:hypothetical protein
MSCLNGKEWGTDGGSYMKLFEKWGKGGKLCSIIDEKLPNSMFGSQMIP